MINFLFLAPVFIYGFVAIIQQRGGFDNMENYSYSWGDIKPELVSGKLWYQYLHKYSFEMTYEDYHPMGWIPRIPNQIISTYSNEGELVLDQFVGGGTTLMEALMLNRKAIGCDINPAATYLSREIIRMTLEGEGIYIRKKDARKLYGIKDESIDLICTQLPYPDGSGSSMDIEGDLSAMNPDEYMTALGKAAAESFRVLKRGRYCALMTGDIKKDNCIVPVGIGTANAFLNSGFMLKKITINNRKESEGCSRYNKYCSVTRDYLMVFTK